MDAVVVTKARFLDHIGRVFKNPDGSPFVGEFVKDDCIYRLHGDHGLLHCATEAAIGVDAHCEWWLNGVLHRADGPAVFSLYDKASYKEYWFNGVLHRENGPALIHEDMDGNVIRKEYWIHGEKVDAF